MTKLAFAVRHPLLRRTVPLEETTVRAILARIDPFSTHADAGRVTTPACHVLDALETVRERQNGRCTAALRDWWRIRRLRALCLRLQRGAGSDVVFDTDDVVPRWIDLRQKRAARELSLAFG